MGYLTYGICLKTSQRTRDLTESNIQGTGTRSNLVGVLSYTSMVHPSYFYTVLLEATFVHMGASILAPQVLTSNNCVRHKEAKRQSPRVYYSTLEQVSHAARGAKSTM